MILESTTVASAPAASALATRDGGVDTTLANAVVYIAPERFDIHVAPNFESTIESALAHRTNVVIDLRMVEFIDEYMCRSIADATARAHARGLDVTLGAKSAAASLTLDFVSRTAA